MVLVANTFYHSCLLQGKKDIIIMVRIIIAIKALVILFQFVVNIFSYVLVSHKNYSLEHFQKQNISKQNFPDYGTSLVVIEASMWLL